MGGWDVPGVQCHALQSPQQPHRKVLHETRVFTYIVLHALFIQYLPVVSVALSDSIVPHYRQVVYLVLVYSMGLLIVCVCVVCIWGCLLLKTYMFSACNAILNCMCSIVAC